MGDVTTHEARLRPRSGEARYRGRDRRSLVRASRAPGWGAVVAVPSTAIVGALLIATAAPDLDAAMLDRVGGGLEAAAYGLALLGAVLCVLRWKLVGEVAALYLGLASGLYASVILGSASILGGRAALGVLPAAGRIVIGGLIIAALLSPEVDAGLRAWRAIGWAAAILTGAAASIVMMPGFGALFSSPSGLLQRGLDTPGAAGAGTLLLWLAGGVTATFIGCRDRRPLIAWFGLGWVILTMGTAFTLLFGPQETPAAVAALVLQLVGFVCIAAGSASELIRAYRVKDGRLLASVASARAAEARLQDDLEVQHDRAHEARNMLAAIEAATYTLERFREQLPPDEQAALSSSIATEVHRLQRLVEPGRSDETVGRFRPSEAVAPLVTWLSAEMVDVHVDVPPHLIVVGRVTDTVQAIHNVLENARRYGGGRIVLRATLEGATVVLRIADDGPGIAAGEERAIFERGVRGRAGLGTDGRGLGLAISRDLMRRQGGELRHAASSGTDGAAFEIVLPGFSSLLGDPNEEQLVDMREKPDARRELRLVRTSAVAVQRRTARADESEVTARADDLIAQ